MIKRELIELDSEGEKGTTSEHVALLVYPYHSSHAAWTTFSLQ
jgi:hypothetical protein